MNGSEDSMETLRLVRPAVYRRRTIITTTALTLGVAVSSLFGVIDAGAAPKASAPAVLSVYESCNACSYSTTDYLNLREGPGTTYDVLTVIPAGDGVLGWSETQNGYRKVKYMGHIGWASDDYLAIEEFETAPNFGGVATATDDLNLRAGPSTSEDVQLVIPAGGEVETSDQTSNGYRWVRYDGVEGWASDDYLGGNSGGGSRTVGTGVTNDYVNFRQGPGTGYAVHEVLGPGTAVEMTGNVSAGFRLVYLNGMSGWVYDDYLSPPASLPNAPTTGTMTTTDYVNVRVGPGLGSSVREVLSPGVEVEITDFVQNGFRHVSVDGMMGWIHDDYLS